MLSFEPYSWKPAEVGDLKISAPWPKCWETRDRADRRARGTGLPLDARARTRDRDKRVRRLGSARRACAQGAQRRMSRAIPTMNASVNSCTSASSGHSMSVSAQTAISAVNVSHISKTGTQASAAASKERISDAIFTYSMRWLSCFFIAWGGCHVDERHGNRRHAEPDRSVQRATQRRDWTHREARCHWRGGACGGLRITWPVAVGAAHHHAIDAGVHGRFIPAHAGNTRPAGSRSASNRCAMRAPIS